jgi:hypothetical protein
MKLKELSEKIKNDLDINQVFDLLFSFGGDPVIQNNMIISRTICHGGDSHKLYYYDNSKLFKCYTACSSSYDIFELIIKIKKVNGVEISLPQAVNFIINYYGLTIENENFQQEREELQDWKILNKYEKNNLDKKEEKIVEFKFYDKKILEHLPHPHIIPWEREGINRTVMEYDGICYDPSNQGIVIPHYNIDGKLIGIRERTLIKENEDSGKYKPAILNYKMYNHSLGFNLYNLNNSKNIIKKIKKVIVFEGEKSALLYQSYFGIDNDISVAVCGSNLTNYQVDLLLSLGVSEIIIAFDKQFKEIGDGEWKTWTKKLTDINKKYSSKVLISFIFDKENMLGYKDSPIDKGKEIFLELFKKRVII